MKNLFILSLVVVFVSCSPKLSPDAGWARQRWVVTEMKGIPVQLSGGRRDAFIRFETDEKRFTGNGGCNQINGGYAVDKKEIRFGEVVSTKMSCEDIASVTLKVYPNMGHTISQDEIDNANRLVFHAQSVKQ